MLPPFVDIIKHFRNSTDIINLCNSGLYENECNDPDVWKYLINQKFGINTDSDHPRDDYITMLDKDSVITLEYEDVLRYLSTDNDYVAVLEFDDRKYIKIAKERLLRTPNYYSIVDYDHGLITIETDYWNDTSIPFIFSLLDTSENRALINKLVNRRDVDNVGVDDTGIKYYDFRELAEIIPVYGGEVIIYDDSIEKFVIFPISRLMNTVNKYEIEDNCNGYLVLTLSNEKHIDRKIPYSFYISNDPKYKFIVDKLTS